MYAVLIELDVSGVGREEGLHALREQIAPAIARLPGFRSGTWLTGNDEWRGLSLTVWEEREQAEAMAERFGPGSSPAASASVVRCEVREVALVA